MYDHATFQDGSSVRSKTRWYQNEADRARDAWVRPKKVWQRCVVGAWRLESPTEKNTCFPLVTGVPPRPLKSKKCLDQIGLKPCDLESQIDLIALACRCNAN